MIDTQYGWRPEMITPLLSSIQEGQVVDGKTGSGEGMLLTYPAN